jgi:hypothetical protein
MDGPLKLSKILCSIFGIFASVSIRDHNTFLIRTG